MTPIWLIVDHARRRLRSGSSRARTAESSIVTATETPSSARAGSARTSRGKSWLSTTVPAATIVAAWMSAEAGVGPAIASSSQSWKGSCADLPRTPTTTRTRAAVRSVGSAALDVQWAMTSARPVVPAPAMSSAIPSSRPMSATRVTMKAVCAARRGSGRRDQCPMSR